MGQLYQSLTRNQNLLPVVQNIQKSLDEKRKQENLNKFLDILQSTRKGIENTYDQGIVRGKNQPTTETWDTLPEQGPQNKVSTSQLIGPKTQQEANAPPPQPEIPMDVGVSVDVLGDYSSTPGQIADVNRKANRQLADYLFKMATMEDVSSEQKQSGTNMLSQIIKGEQPPEKEYSTLGANQEMIERDPSTGEVKSVYKNESKGTGKKENIYERIETFNISGKPMKMGLRKDSGEWEQLGEAYEKGTTINVADNTPELKIHSNIGELGKMEDDYKYWDELANTAPPKPEYGVDKDGNKYVSNEREIKKAKEEREAAILSKNTIMGEIIGITDELASQLNDKIPGFEGTANLLYKKIGGDPSKIDAVVEEELKGKSPDTIRNMKRILKARIFKGKTFPKDQKIK